MGRVGWLVLLAACTGGEPAGPPEIVSFTVDPTSIAAGGEVTVTLEVENFELGGHDEVATAHTDAETHTDETAAGHVHVYLDTVLENPLAMSETEVTSFTIPVETEPGAHVLIARLHNADHTIVEPEVTAEADLEVLPAE